MSTPLKLRVPLPRVFGPGEIIASEGAFAALSVLPASRIAAVVSARGRRDPAIERWLGGTHSYELRGIAPSWSGEPTLEALAGTLAELTDYRPDWIVAIGGGSVIDGSKLCWALYEHPAFPRDRLGVPFALPPLRALSRFVAVPTTAATGSEASSSATFDTDGGQGKAAAVTHDFLPDVAILDPRLVKSLPLAELATGAMDVLAHAIEGYVSKLPNPMADAWAESAVAAVVEVLGQDTPPDLAGLGRLQIAACHAGHVQNLRLVGFAHALAHRLSNYKIPHAVGVGLLLPEVMRRNATVPAVAARYDRLARMARLADAAALIEFIANLPHRFGIKARLGGWAATQPTDGDLGALAQHTETDLLARFAPVPLRADALQAMVKSVW
jgi:alcohol dehydrogenase class IV